MTYLCTGILHSNKNDQITITRNYINDSPKDNTGWKKPVIKNIHILWLHLYEFERQAGMVLESLGEWLLLGRKEGCPRVASGTLGRILIWVVVKWVLFSLCDKQCTFLNVLF